MEGIVPGISIYNSAETAYYPVESVLAVGETKNRIGSPTIG